MFKTKTITIKEGGGREQLLREFGSSLHGEKVTEGDYVVMISKVPPDVRVTVRPKAVRKKKVK